MRDSQGGSIVSSFLFDATDDDPQSSGLDRLLPRPATARRLRVVPPPPPPPPRSTRFPCLAHSPPLETLVLHPSPGQPHVFLVAPCRTHTPFLSALLRHPPPPSPPPPEHLRTSAPCRMHTPPRFTMFVHPDDVHLLCFLAPWRTHTPDLTDWLAHPPGAEHRTSRLPRPLVGAIAAFIAAMTGEGDAVDDDDDDGGVPRHTGRHRRGGDATPTSSSPRADGRLRDRRMPTRPSSMMRASAGEATVDGGGGGVGAQSSQATDDDDDVAAFAMARPEWSWKPEAPRSIVSP